MHFIFTEYIIKIERRAFLNEEKTYDDSYLGAVVPLSEWHFSFPYLFSLLRYILNNITYTVIYGLRALFG